MSTIQLTRARRLQVQLYDALGYGYVSKIAEEFGLTRQHVSGVLNEQRESKELLDRLEAWLDEQEVANKAA